MQRQLVVIAGPDQGRRFDLEDGQTLAIGRGQASDTKINDPRMSRVHCHVSVDGAKTLVADNGSSSGTFVGSERVTTRELKPGEILRLGDTHLRYQLDSESEEATMAGPIRPAASSPPPKVKPLQDLLGTSLAHYRLDAIITSGQTGMVFKARDTQHDRPAAVKVLQPDLTHGDEQQQRFVRAMKTMMPIRHPNIVQLYNAGKTGPYCWAAMELVDGESLLQVIDRIGIEGMLDWREVWRAAVHIGRALEEAYDRKIIHRNVTPTNILRRRADKVCLLGDLMLAKALEGTLAQQVTRPGQLIGDLPYASPERTRDQLGVDGRSDIYALGATCYALLTGRPPFESDSLPELIRRIRQEEPAPPKQFQLSINDMFQDAILKMLAKRPEDRYQTPAELLRDLSRIGKFQNLDADWSGWAG